MRAQSLSQHKLNIIYYNNIIDAIISKFAIQNLMQ